MIAALSCDARSDYNQFVNQYRPHLSFHGNELRQYFRKKHGRSHKRALNRFVTLLANGASQESIRDRGGFCAQSLDIFAALRTAPAHHAPLALQAVALDTDWRYNPAKVVRRHLCSAPRNPSAKLFALKLSQTKRGPKPPFLMPPF